MNLLLAHPSELSSDQGYPQIVVEGRRAAHVRQVLRAKAGERIRVGVVRQSIGTAEIVESNEERVVLGALHLEVLGAPPRVRLIVALPRPKALRRLLQTAASFGVQHMDLVNAWRVDKSYWGSPQVAQAAMEEELWLGCEQGRHAWLPTIATQRFLVPFLEAFSAEEELRLLAHPGGERWLQESDAKAETCVIGVGPEGGWIEEELSSFAEAGFESFALSESILRSEIAVAAALAQMELLRARG